MAFQNKSGRYQKWPAACLRSALQLLLCFALLLGLVSLTEAAGSLTVNPINPRYFVDSSGEVVYLSGGYVSNNLIDRSDKDEFDFSRYLDFLQIHNHNFVRFRISEQAAWTSESSAKVEFHPLPYERTGPGTALDGGLKFDLSRFNQAYFDRLRSRVLEARDRGIYVSVMLFQDFNGSSGKKKKKNDQAKPWFGHPFHSDNNINGINGDFDRNGNGDEVHSLNDPAITEIQEAYVRKLVDTLNDLDNVLYEVCGECSLGNLSWQYHIINYLKAYQAIKPNQRPVGISYQGSTGDLADEPADWILLSGKSLNPTAAPFNKVIVLDMDGALLNRKTSDQWVWKSFMQGYHPIYPDADPLRDGINQSVRDAIGFTVDYSQIVDLSFMQPNSDICSSKYCLVDPGLEYLVYLPSGGKVTVNLSGNSGVFEPIWFHPLTGQATHGGTVHGGSNLLFTSPLKGPAILHLSSLGEAMNFSLSSFGGLSVSQGASVTTTVIATLLSGNLEPVTFSVSGLPQLATASFSSSSCSPTCSSTLTIATSGSTPGGTSTITVTASGGGVTKTITFSLNVSLLSVTLPTVATPTISPSGGTYTGSVSVSLQTSTAEASIYYTTDGSAPTQSSTLYTGAITLSSSAVVKTKAFKTGSNASSEASATFTIVPQPSQLNLTWQDNSTNENGFQIERKIGAGGSYAQIASVAANITSYVDFGLVRGTTYCYRVRAVNSSTTSSYSNDVCATAP